jgi:L-amino acid N-acyltransferase YncA
MTVSLQRQLGIVIAKDPDEYEKDIVLSLKFLAELKKKGADVFSFVERSWCFKMPDPPSEWKPSEDNVALLTIDNYRSWLRGITKKTHHNPVKRALKKGVTVAQAEADDELFEAIWRIYNETPVRQDRAFTHYGLTLEAVKNIFTNEAKNPDAFFVAAYFDGSIVGFMQINIHGQTAVIRQILSLMKYSRKSINKAMIAKTVEICSSRGVRWIIYARMGNHPSLDRFKEENGFVRFDVRRFYVPLSRKGKVAMRIGLHKDLKDSMPSIAKKIAIPLYNWNSKRKLSKLIRK